MTKQDAEELLKIDPRIKDLQNNAKKIPVYFSALEYSMGILNWGGSVESIKELDSQVQKFQASKSEAILIYFVGVVNHWVTVVAHKKDADSKTDLYLLDSTNSKHLNMPTYEDMHTYYMRVGAWNKIRMGLKPSSKFMAKMYLQSWYTQRAFYPKLHAILNTPSDAADRPTFSKLFTSQLLNMMLRDFWNQTKQLGKANPPTLQTSTEGKVPERDPKKATQIEKLK